MLVDRIVVKEFDEDDIHRLSDSIGTAFYEGEGDVYLEVQSTDTVDQMRKGTRYKDKVQVEGQGTRTSDSDNQSPRTQCHSPFASFISTIGLNWTEYSLKNQYLIYFHLIILLVPARLVKASARYWVLIATW